MLEETRMDKKSINRSTIPQSRATAVDCKKSTELTYNKPWPRNNKKRETSGTVPKNENYRKNLPVQRGRGQIDKKPRSLGANNFTVGGAENTRLENDEEPEIGSLLMPGSKKQNLNHLLNFMYNPRGSNERRGPPPRKQVGRSQNRIYHHFEQDLYLRTYCQFVVKQDGDYKENLLNPDLPITWEQIEEIVVRTVGEWQCPICLGHPVAGRVGICGHVYCWACILHYSSEHEKQPPPCPVCIVTLYVANMKPTRLVKWDTTEEVTMRLVRRLRGSTIVEAAPPRGVLTEIKEPSVLPLEEQLASPYARIFSANQQQILDIIERDKEEISAQIQAEIDVTELVYLEQALNMLKIKKEKLKRLLVKPKIVEAAVEDKVVIEKNDLAEKKYDWFDFDEDEGATCLDDLSDLDINDEIAEMPPEPDRKFGFDFNDNPLENLDVRDSPTDIDPINITEVDRENQSRYFYFYQAEDGQQVFLNSLNVRLLVASWGALVAAPPLIRSRVLHRDTVSLGEQTRKHMPYTAHLPLHCSFDVVELDLKPPDVTPEALENLAGEIERRARNRARQEREERRRERAYHRAMEGPPKPDFFSDVLFPPPISPLGSPPEHNLYEPGPSVEPTPSTSRAAGPSFAKMAGTSGTWRVRKTNVPPPIEVNEESHAPRSLVLSDAIEAALQASPANASSKKKKSKQKLLFATGMNRLP